MTDYYPIQWWDNHCVTRPQWFKWTPLLNPKYYQQWMYSFTHLPIVPHICVSELGQWTGLALVQIMACRLFGAKPLFESVLANCQFDSWEQISVKFKSKFCNFHSRKWTWKCRLPRWRPFCPGGDEFIVFCVSVKHSCINLVTIVSLWKLHCSWVHQSWLNPHFNYLCHTNAIF